MIRLGGSWPLGYHVMPTERPHPHDKLIQIGYGHVRIQNAFAVTKSSYISARDFGVCRKKRLQNQKLGDAAERRQDLDCRSRFAASAIGSRYCWREVAFPEGRARTIASGEGVYSTETGRARFSILKWWADCRINDSSIT